MNTHADGSERGPLIVQSDLQLLLEVDHPQYEAAREALSGFAEMVKSPEYIHTYRLTQLSLWNAASAGIHASQVVSALHYFAKHTVPSIVEQRILDWSERYGRVRLKQGVTGFFLECENEWIAQELARDKKLMACCEVQLDTLHFLLKPDCRGRAKQALIALEYPAEDLAGYAESDPLRLSLREQTLSGGTFALRDYQLDALCAFHANGAPQGGHGVIVLPCGAGKTIVGMAVMAHYQLETLILTTSVTAVRQWISELLDKTDLSMDQIGEYTGEHKEICPVTVSTYQILTMKSTEYAHFSLIGSRKWGLILYDEVHTLPAPMFRLTAELQARRRLGLTATLIREDGLETDVFSLIGPKRFEVPWKVLEQKNRIAKAQCAEIRVPLPQELRMLYATGSKRDKFRIASENYAKHEVVQMLLKRHAGAHVLVIGQYLEQLRALSAELHAPILTGQTPNKKRDALYEGFRSGEIPVLVVSKVANYAIDLPDANVAIEVSGSFGSRQEEAQRLGRLLRPKEEDNRAWFYTLCSKDTCEQSFAGHRQLFLTEQGYPYTVLDSAELDKPEVLSLTGDGVIQLGKYSQ